MFKGTMVIMVYFNKGCSQINLSKRQLTLLEKKAHFASMEQKIFPVVTKWLSRTLDLNSIL